MKYVLIACLALFVLGCTSTSEKWERRQQIVSNACLKCCSEETNPFYCADLYRINLRKLKLRGDIYAPKKWCDLWVTSYRKSVEVKTFHRKYKKIK